MNDKSTKKVDTKEFEFPETLFICDIDNKVFQGIILKCLSRIDGIALIEGNFIDSLLSRSQVERVGGIHCEQDTKSHSINIKIELNILYGLAISQKANEIQTKVADEIVRLTGIHVASVHVVFKGIATPENVQKSIEMLNTLPQVPGNPQPANFEQEYNDHF